MEKTLRVWYQIHRHISTTTFCSQFKFTEKSLCCNSTTGHHVATNVCTCHDGAAIVLCVNFYRDHSVGPGREQSEVTLKLNYPLVKWVLAKYYDGKLHGDVIKCKHYPRHWPFVRGIDRSPVKFPSQRAVTRNFDVFFNLCLNERWNKQSWVRWFETSSRPLWRHSNVVLEVWISMSWHRCPFNILRPKQNGQPLCRPFFFQTYFLGWYVFYFDSNFT